jgi:hypothetical protein
MWMGSILALLLAIIAGMSRVPWGMGRWGDHREGQAPCARLPGSGTVQTRSAAAMTRREQVDDAIEASRARRRTCDEGDLGMRGAVTRQAFLQRGLTLILGSVTGAALVGGCGRDGGGMGEGMMDDGGMPDWMMSRGGMGPQMRGQMRVIHRLLVDHEQIRREVEEIAGGVRTTTVSPRPEIADMIRTHVRQMKARVEDGEPIRQMDPVFREIFEHYTKIDMEVEEISGGVRVTETSDDPQVVLLIRQHARRAVSEFVAEGMRRAMQPTPLPAAYEG